MEGCLDSISDIYPLIRWNDVQSILQIFSGRTMVGTGWDRLVHNEQSMERILQRGGELKTRESD